MIVHRLLLLALMLTFSQQQVQSATFQLNRLWQALRPSPSESPSSEEAKATEAAKSDDTDLPYRVVPFANFSVIHETYTHTSGAVYEASLNDPHRVIPTSLRIIIESDAEVDVAFHCSGDQNDFHITTSLTGSEEPKIDLLFNPVTATVRYLLKQKSKSTVRLTGDISVFLAGRHIAANSSVVLPKSTNKVVHHGSECASQQHVTVAYNKSVGLCDDHQPPCEQGCDPETGHCLCQSGYITDPSHPEKCLATYLLVLDMPEWKSNVERLNISEEQYKLLLALHMRTSVPVGVYKVEASGDTVTVITKDTEHQSAMEAASRLRRELHDGELEGPFLGLSSIKSSAVQAPHGLQARQKRQSCGTLSQVFSSLVQPPFDICSIRLPTNVRLCHVCIPSLSGVVPTLVSGAYRITVPVPDSLANDLLPEGLQLTGTRLSVSVAADTRAVTVLLSGRLVTENTEINVDLTFDTVQGTASLEGETSTGISVDDILSLFSSDLASSAGLDGVGASSAAFRLEISQAGITYFIRLTIDSARDLATNLIGAAGLPTGPIQDVLETAGLDSFDIQDIEFLITNTGGSVCAQVTGRPVLEQLAGFPPITVMIKVYDLDTPRRFVQSSFSIDGSVSLANAIRGFLPTVDLTGIPGISGLQLPEFALSVRKPRLPGLPPLPTLPDFGVKLPNIRARVPRLSAPSLNVPGVNFLAFFRPGKVGLPDVLSIGGGLGLGPLCFNLKNEDDGTGAQLSTITDVVFPTLSIGDLPQPFGSLLDVEVRELCLNRTAKEFTAEVAWPSKIDLVPSKSGFLSLSNTVVRVVISAAQRPILFDFSAQSTASLGKFPVDVAFARSRSGSYIFTATPADDSISVSEIVEIFGDSAGDIQTALDNLQLSPLTLSGLRVEVARKSDVRISFAGTVSYRKLPSVTFELVVNRLFTYSATLALGISTTTSTLANVVSSVVPSVDISDIPVVGDITLPAVSCLFTNASLPAQLSLPFTNAELVKLASVRLDTRISFLVPINFPRVGLKDFKAGLQSLRFEFRPPDRETSLKDLAQLALPGVNLEELSPPSGLPGLQNIFLEHLLVDAGKKTICASARLAGQTFDVIPSILTLRDIRIDLCLQKEARVTKRNLLIAGTLTVGNVVTMASLESAPGLLTLSAFFPQRLVITDVLSQLGGSFIPLGSDVESTLKANGFDSFGLQDTSIVANRSTGSGSTVSIMSTAILPGFTSQVEILVTGVGARQTGAAAVFSLPEIDIAQIVSDLSGIDLTGVPVLEDLSVPAAVTIINRNFQLPRGFAFSSPLLRVRSLSSGISVNFLSDIGKRVSNFQLSFRPGSFDIDLESLPSVDEALQRLLPDVLQSDAFKSLPSLVPGFGGLRVTRIAYDASLKKFTIEADLNQVTIIENLLDIRSAKLSFSYTKAATGRSRQLNERQRRAQTQVAINGQANILTLLLDLRISYDTAQRAFTFHITSPSNRIGFSQLFDELGSALNDLSNPVIGALRLRDSEIINPLFGVQQSRGTAFRIRGTPTIGGFSLFTAEVLVNTAPRQLILTLSNERFSIGDLIEMVTGLDVTSLPFLSFLNGPSAVGVTLSATNIDRIPFPIDSYPLNETTRIDRGLGFTIALRLPEQCDDICNFIKLLLGDQPIILRVTGINGPQATLSYRLPAGISLGSFNLYNIDFGFSLSASRPPTVGLTNIEMDLPVPFAADGQRPLHFRGSMLVDPTFNVEASLQMVGIYINAFGIPILSFGNVDAGFRSRIDCPVCVTQLRLGGEVAIGKNCYTGNSGKCVIVRGVFNIDALDAKNNYYFFSANQLSYRALLVAIGVPESVPGLQILDAARITNYEASYSSMDRNIPFGNDPAGKTIKAGMVFKGTFSVLFLVNVQVECAVELLFGVPKSVNALVTVDPINLGPLKFTAASDSSKGAKFELKANLLPPSVFFSLDGALTIDIINFRASVRATIDNQGLSLNAEGPIFGLPATFDLTAQFRNVRDPRSFRNFQIEGCFKNLAADLFNGVRNALNSAFRRIRREYDRLRGAANAAQQALNSALGELNLKKRIEADRRRAFNKARSDLNSAQRTVNGLCRIRDCTTYINVPKPCVKQSCSCAIRYPCCSGWSCSTCCRTVCVPYPSTCGTHRIPSQDPVCLGENAACAPIRAAAFVALETAKKALKAAEEAVKVAEAATAAATKEWNDADLVNRGAQGALAPIKALFDAIERLLNTLLNAFQVHSVCFKVEVQSVSDGTVGVSIDLTVSGRRQKITADLNLRDIAGYAASLARRFFGRFF